jgi:hypothetical protein
LGGTQAGWCSGRVVQPKTGRKNVSSKEQQLPAAFSRGFLASLDGRTEICKALNSRRLKVIQDLGGDENIGRIKMTLIEKYIFAKAHLQSLEYEIVEGAEAAKFDEWTKRLNSVLQIAKMLGIERKEKTKLTWGAVTPASHEEVGGATDE